MVFLAFSGQNQSKARGRNSGKLVIVSWLIDAHGDLKTGLCGSRLCGSGCQCVLLIWRTHDTRMHYGKKVISRRHYDGLGNFVLGNFCVGSPAVQVNVTLTRVTCLSIVKDHLKTMKTVSP
ncbi:hypothetical protein ILYODFUR_012578 [Ilyodon furcidens]|uniref:Uncharacterized protein n=1 Tax=Ilyodon furcidens TaxID=33524 RepID=A0ABV0SWF1_9TELE